MGMKPSWQCAEGRLRERYGSREVEALLKAPSEWGVRIGYYGQRKWTLVTVVNIDKPKELWGLNQNGKWVVRRDCRTYDTGNTPTGRQSGPKVFVVKYVERGNLMPSPLLGQTNRKACCGRYGEKGWKKRRPSCNGVDTGWKCRLDITRPAREQTSIGCFVARKLVEPIFGGKANEATLCESCALHRMGFGCQCVSQRWLGFSITGSPLCRGWPLKGLNLELSLEESREDCLPNV